eukprot:TRINITY_DN10994_c0_g1_i1.p1 TRINITY_DN10994_c0_g1~~TRINITY_DN10994_c0_g1_i1.p1  ORF type:complete len:278 (-),score=27.34 TRINITY_DN10994_c0_g1_i1:66-899(-)
MRRSVMLQRNHQLENIWGRIKNQPIKYQVMNTNLKVVLELFGKYDYSNISDFETKLVCTTMDNCEYEFQQAIASDKWSFDEVTPTKSLVRLKVQIKAITKLRNEEDYCPMLPLQPHERKGSEARFWLRIYNRKHPQIIETEKFFLYIRRDEARKDMANNRHIRKRNARSKVKSLNFGNRNISPVQQRHQPLFPNYVEPRYNYSTPLVNLLTSPQVNRYRNDRVLQNVSEVYEIQTSPTEIVSFFDQISRKYPMEKEYVTESPRSSVNSLNMLSSILN